MKKLFILAAAIFAVLSFQSCGSYYEYLQVLSTEPTNENSPITKTNGGILYEDDDCAIFYKFWNKGGNPGFEFYNKTDKIIYIDLSKTFFIKNGTAFDYFQQQTITNTKSSSVSTAETESYSLSATSSYSGSISQYYAGNFGYLPTTSLSPITSSASASKTKSFSAMATKSFSKAITIGHSTSLSTTNNPILSIPPKSSKVIRNFSITTNEIVNCNLKSYPEKYSTIEYTEENTPIVFANFITFKVGENSQYKNIENEFYVSKISNYVRQYVSNYVKRDKTCEDILTPDQIKKQKKQADIYDLYITVGDESSFYMAYGIYSKSKLYNKIINNYYWDSYRKGYINTSSKTSISTENTSNSTKTTNNSQINNNNNNTNTTEIQNTTTNSTNFINEDKVVNDKYKKIVASEISKVSQLYSQKQLLKSNVFTAYKEYANQIFNSTKEKDWNKLDNINKLLQEIIKPKNSALFSEIENSLSSAESIDEKTNILIKYYSQIK